MTSRRKFLSLLLLPLMASLISAPAEAKKKHKSNQSANDACAQPGQCRGYGDYLNDVQNQNPDDQYLDGDEVEMGGRRLYRYRMLDPNGNVRDILIDPNTGQWLNN